MRKNIRRSLVVAAAASGVWLLGAATASADEQPAGPDTGAVTDTLDGARKVTEELPAEVQLPSTPSVPATPGSPSTPEKPSLPALPTVPGATGGIQNEVDGLRDGLPRTEVVDKVTDKPVQKVKPVKTAAEAAKAAKKIRAAKKVRDAVQQSVDTGSVLPAVPGLPATLDRAGVRPGQVTTLPHGIETGQLTGTVKTTLGTVQPTVDGVSSALLPPLVRRTVAQVPPVTDQALADTEAAAGNALATTTPFARGVVTGTGAFAQNVTADTLPYARTLSTGATYDVRTLAENAVAGTQRVTVVPGAGELTNAANVPVLPVATTLPARF